MQIPHDLYITGEWRPSTDGRRREIVDPATEQVVDSVPIATEKDVDTALASAERGWRAWREVDAWSRTKVLRTIAGLLRDRRDVIAAVLTEEQGKPLSEAKGELSAAADQFDWFADEARHLWTCGRGTLAAAATAGSSSAHRPGRRVSALEFPCPPGSTENGPGDRRGLLDHRQAAHRGATHGSLPRSGVPPTRASLQGSWLF